MRTLRTISTLVTGLVLVAGGVVLVAAGRTPVAVLGGVTMVVGIVYAWAGLVTERVIHSPAAGAGANRARRPPQGPEPEILA